MNLSLFNVLVICLAIDTIYCVCPDPTLLSPCSCSNDSIYCEGKDVKFENLTTIFGKLERLASKHFKLFVLKNTDIIELKENEFKDISFDAIRIQNCTKLKRIDQDFFIQDDKSIKLVEIWNNPSLTSSHDYSIFKILSKLINVEEISLDFNNITTIPWDAFNLDVVFQDKLETLTFSGPSIKTIEDSAFSNLRNLKTLSFGYTPINSIPEYAFEFDNSSDKTLTINFVSCDKLTSSSFAEYSLTNLKRPTIINFGDKGNHIEYLDEKIFLPFLNMDERNKVNLLHQKFNCKDCRNHWITKFQGIQNRLENLHCANGTGELSAYGNFAHCGISQFERQCRSTEDAIYCGGNTTIDLKKTFKNFSKTLETNEKTFKLLFLNNTAIQVLDDNSFDDIVFDRIEIEACSKLTTISRNAFSRTDLFTKEVVFDNNPLLTSADNSIFDILSSFINLEYIQLTQNKFTTIPANAFKPVRGYQKNLAEIYFSGPSLTTIGASAFFLLSNLQNLKFYQTSFTTIPENTFQFDDSSNLTLNIYFNGTSMLKNATIFAKNSLVNIKRPTKLHLGTQTDKLLTVLDESVFLPFFQENSKNSIDFNSASLNCIDCKSYWLRKHDNILYRLKNDSMRCSNDVDFGDNTNFPNCPNTYF